MTPSNSPAVPYNRNLYGGWIDADGDCQNTRQEVLIAESLVPVVLDSRGCTVVSGQWLDPYTGQTFTSPSGLDIDHFIKIGRISTSFPKGIAILEKAKAAASRQAEKILWVDR